ncbi:NAD(P)/FAD-dependent oxidoreductase [Halobacteriales archaeon QS_1_68_20]|nr:MAG: NAD(P)/FAD-dependent oxidoreductase [Halobacteriales archaeon QS_1_68_20]
MTPPPKYEVAVVGAGPAGSTAAVYAARLGHRVALLDAGGGRHEAVARVHNLIGVSPETSGAELADLTVEQLIGYGVDFFPDAVTGVERVATDPSRFAVTADRADLRAERVVLATGFTDVEPDVSGLEQFAGRGVHYCVHCDAYTLGDHPVFVLGHDDHAANVAMLLLNVTADVDLLLDGADPEWSDDTARQVEAHPLDVVETPAEAPVPEAPTEGDEWLRGLRFEDGSVREYAGGFAVYGRSYNHDLARELGCELHEDGAVTVDEDRRTSVEGVYAAGDLTHGQNQTTIALGDGAYAGIAVHRDLRTFPVADELAEVPEAPAMADDLRARMRRVNDRGMTVGMTPDRDVHHVREGDDD